MREELQAKPKTPNRLVATQKRITICKSPLYPAAVQRFYFGKPSESDEVALPESTSTPAVLKLNLPTPPQTIKRAGLSRKPEHLFTSPTPQRSNSGSSSRTPPAFILQHPTTNTEFVDRGGNDSNPLYVFDSDSSDHQPSRSSSSQMNVIELISESGDELGATDKILFLLVIWAKVCSHF